MSEKSSCANIEDRIAKNLADEVLRNYPGMKGVHSNTSIRKLLEAEAAKVMNEPIMRPVITTVVREKQGINANNLPYLHRNPAIWYSGWLIFDLLMYFNNQNDPVALAFVLALILIGSAGKKLHEKAMVIE